jgi:hypothetical protein
MRKASSLTLGILKSFNPQANMVVAFEGVIVTCTEDDPNQLTEDSTVTVSRVLEMPHIDMS